MEKELSLDVLVVDHDLVLGQIRPIDPVRVHEMALAMSKKPPPTLASVLVWDMAGV